jgi:histone deacetylase 1/2
MLMILNWSALLLQLLLDWFLDLRSEFDVKDLGPLHYFLGIEVSTLSSSLVLTQKKYALDLLRHAGMLLCQSVSTPMTSTENLNATYGTLLSHENSTKYRSIVGGLPYLLHTRPNMPFAVNKVCQYPRSYHWYVVKHILHYVHMTVFHGLHLRADSSSLISTFSDVTGLEALMIGDPQGDM